LSTRNAARCTRSSTKAERITRAPTIDARSRPGGQASTANAARDAVKKEALRRAGIGYVEVVAGDTPAELRRVVERLVGAK
jgi:hypothetical protein